MRARYIKKIYLAVITAVALWIGCQQACLAGWVSKHLESSTGAPLDSSIAIANNGTVYISYYYGDSSDLRMAKRSGGVWTASNVDTNNAGSYNAIGLDKSGNPHIVYLGNDDVKHASYNGAAWTLETIDAAGGTYGSMSMYGDEVHVAYINPSTYDLTYAKKTTTWAAVATPDAGTFASTSIDVHSGNVYISYVSTNTLKYAYKPSGGSWAISTIANDAASVSMGNSISGTGVSTVWIAYYNTSGNLAVARYNGAIWSISTVDSGSTTGQECSLVVDASNNVHISYLDSANHYLKYAKWNGSNWTITVVDSLHTVSSGPTYIDVDTQGYAHISYNIDIGGGAYQLTYAYFETPEPFSALLFLMGLPGLAWLRRRLR